MSTTPATFKAALIQMRSGVTPAANVDAAARMIDEAKTAGADYVQTPEMTNIMDGQRERFFATIQDGIPRPRAQAPHLRSCRLAGDQGGA
jgi:predicted amidohydrolase